MKRILCLFLLMALLCGCTGNNIIFGPGADPTVPASKPQTNDPANQTPVPALPYYPDRGLNPFTTTDPTNRALFSLIYQGLFAVSGSYECYPILCRSFNISADMTTYTFHPEEAIFSDGTPLTATDVAASLQAAMDSPWYGSRLQQVKTVTAYGDAVVVELHIPMENLPLLLDIPIVKAGQVSANAPLGTGPYRLDGSQLRRQAGWWCDADLAVDRDSIPLIAADSAKQIQDAFSFRKISLVCTDPAARDRAPFHGDYELWEAETGLFLYLVCNKESDVLDHDALRAALTHAIDRDSLVSKWYHGFAQSATLPCSPDAPFYNENLAQDYAHDPSKFRAALESSGITPGKLVLLLNADDPLRLNVGNSIAAMLAEYGFTVTVTRATGEDFTKLLKKGEYDLYLAQTRLSANMDLSAFFKKNGSLNYGGLENASLLDLNHSALANAGNYYSLYEKIMDDGRLCPLLFQSYAIYSQRGAHQGLSPARDNVFYYDLGRTMADALMTQ